MSKLSDLWPLLLADATPEEQARVLRIGFRIVVSCSLLWAFGMFAPVGLNGFARADEIDSKIQSAVEPVRAQLGQITTQLAMQDEVLKSIRIDQLAQKLRELKLTGCIAGGADSAVRERLEQEIERTQREYRALAGERYPLPERCPEIGK